MKKKLLSIALSVMMVLSSVGMGISALAEELAAQPANNNVSAKASGEQEVETVEMDTLKYMTLNPQGLVSNMADGFVAVTEQGNSGGVHLRTAKIGASITIDFNGSGFEFYGKKGSGAGDLEISVDGGEAEVVSEYVSGNPEFEALLYKVDLGDTNEDHKIVITTKQGTVANPNFNFDYFKVIREKEEPPVVIEKVTEKVEMEDTSNKYMVLNPSELVGSEAEMTKGFVVANDPGNSGGKYLRTSKIGATVTITFEGCGFEFYTKLGNGAGTLGVTVDGEPVEDISEYIDSSTPQFQQKLLSLDFGNENKEHTIVFTTKETSKNNFNFDYFNIIRAEAVPGVIVSPGDTTYYLDSSAQDGGDGKTEATAFESLEDINNIQFAPGDKILIKRGSTFIGQLYPKGSGSAEKPIIIDVYGEGDKPLIDGNGLYSAVPSYGANGPFGESCSAVYLYNQEYWEINNLAVKNHTSAGDHTYELSGIRVEASGGGVYNHIYIKNCEISDVNGRSQQDDIWTVRPQGGGTDFYGARTTHRTGGINIISYTNRENNASDKTNPGTILDEEPTIFNDILIDGNVITNCDANGITTTNVKGELDDESYRHTNVVISNNEISDVSRSGIITLYTSGVLVEHNVISEFQQYPDGWGCGAWCDRANNMVYQYNEVKNGVDAYDGMAFNFDDMTHDGVIQYNYIHNNAGGSVMLHVRTNSYNRNNTVRYNVCVNDCRDYNVNEAFIVCTGEDSVTQLENAQVYNNTFISSKVLYPVSRGKDIAFTNNIFCLTNPEMANKDGAYNAIGELTTFKNNIFAGYHPASEPKNTGNNSGNIYLGIEDVSKLFVNADKLTSVQGTEAADTFDVANLAKLLPGSAAIDAGLEIDGRPSVDFAGNNVSGTADIGAFEYVSAVDKTAVNEIYQTLKALNPDYYTEETYEAAAKAISELEAALMNDSLTEEDAKALAEKAENAYNALEEKAGDTEALKAKIEGAASYSEDNFKPDTFEALAAAVNEAQKALDSSEALTAKQVDELSAAIDTAIAGLIEVGTPSIIQQDTMTASSPRSHAGNEAKYAIDGSTSSIWHTIWSSSEGQMPVISENGRDNYITLDLGENKSVTRLTYLPRQDSSKNGDIAGYKIMYSTTADGDDFVEIASGTWANNKTVKVVDFDLVNARRIRLVATSTLGDSVNTFISAAEINLYCTDYSALQEKASEAQKLYDDGTGIYTQESLQALKTAIDKANEVLGNADATQKEIDAAEIAVVKAVKGLEKIEDTHITGDVNGDGKVGIEDVTFIQEYLVLLRDDINLEYADINNDSKITVIDATIVQLIISGDYNGQ